MPFEGRAGYEGIAIGTDSLGIDSILPHLGNVSEVKKWITRRFDRETAVMLIAANGLRHWWICAAGGEVVPDNSVP